MTDPIRSHHSLETIWLPSANDRIGATPAESRPAMIGWSARRKQPFNRHGNIGSTRSGRTFRDWTNNEYFRRKIMAWPVLSPRCARGEFRPQRARRPCGNMVIYPASSMHHAQPITPSRVGSPDSLVPSSAGGVPTAEIAVFSRLSQQGLSCR
jgi:hypothetical protein